VRQNNGIVEVFFTRQDAVDEEHALINIVARSDQFREGNSYLLTIEPAIPRK
jgi:hypothetical protein